VTGELDPKSIFEALERHRVRYVVIGGLAATFHGSPLVTNDVDITPERTRDNLERLSAALKDLDARMRTDAVPEGLAFDHNGESLAAADTWNLTTSAGDVDITFVPAGTGGYSDLRVEAIDLDVLGLTIPVAALADVVRSKEAAGREKDARTLPTLRRMLDAEGDGRRGR
jgi:hypothetical protein